MQSRREVQEARRRMFPRTSLLTAWVFVLTAGCSMRPIVGGDADSGSSTGGDASDTVLLDRQVVDMGMSENILPDVSGMTDVINPGDVPDTGIRPDVIIGPDVVCVPSMEVCDNADNNCNGLTDEGLGTSSCGLGACQVTVNRCQNGTIQNCTPLPPAATESCDGIDNDCNGMTDDPTAFPNLTCGMGACVQTIQSCLNGTTQQCPTTMGMGQTELCNGVDDNCNGMTDETFTTRGQACNNNRLGACRLDGMIICNPTNPMAVICSVSPTIMTPPSPQTESCNNRDDNCDGQTDEVSALGNCPVVGTGRCQVGGGPTCMNGTMQNCPTTGDLSRSQAETCNNMDDNCDGQTDNMGNCPSVGEGRCAVGGSISRCTAGVMATCPTTGDLTRIMPESCNLQDDDCDGMTDNLAVATCSTGMLGICGTGRASCTGGIMVCSPLMMSRTETCNGLDDDCNGQTDENLNNLACSTGMLGICSAGTTMCNGSSGSTCRATRTATTETCNMMDDNCNGTTDEGVSSACYTGAASTRNVGICRDGSIACTGTTCVGQVLPGTEQCNLMDDNCNGATDEANALIMCPPPTGTHVVLPACNSGLCQVTSCDPGYFNVNGQFNDGCECQDTGAPNLCTSAQTITLGTTLNAVSATGTIPLGMGNSDWYTVAIPPNYTGTEPMTGISIKRGSGTVSVKLLTGAPEFLFEVRGAETGGSCASPVMSCGSGAMTASGTSTYSFVDSSPTPGSPYISRSTGWPAALWIRVYRASSTVTCNQYQLSVVRM